MTTKIKYFIFGVLTVIMGFLMYFVGIYNHLEVNAENTFKDEPVEVIGFDYFQDYHQESPERIIINSLDVDLPVLESNIINGYWEVFDNAAGWGSGSSVPGEIGNQVIFAHARDGLFEPLRNISLGDSVLVFTKNKWFEYEVNEIKEVFPDQLEVIKPTDDERLTLYTCSGYKDTKRLIVVAKRYKYN